MDYLARSQRLRLSEQRDLPGGSVRYGDDQPEEVLYGTDINTAVKCSGLFSRFTRLDT